MNSSRPKSTVDVKPGTLLYYDFREPERTRGHLQKDRRLKCVQWNIERGYKLDRVKDLLASHDADLVCLQELDIDCERSGNRNCALEIAKALKMLCVFVCEFEEIWSERRDPGSQGGGYHGNAILSRFDFEAEALPHQYQPVDWNSEGERRGQPRRGGRYILAANIKVPDLGTLRAYSLHLEVYTGIFGRLKQFTNVLDDSRRSSAQIPLQLICGDLNTVAHGIARLSPYYCRDWLRVGSLGSHEAEWWNKHLFNHSADNSLTFYINRGLSHTDVASLRNEYFFDPFDASKDMTLHNYHRLYRGKLDWMLLRGWQVLAQGMDDENYQASDHKLLFCLIKPCESEDPNDPGPSAHSKAMQLGRRAGYSLQSKLVAISLVALATIVMASYYKPV